MLTFAPVNQNTKAWLAFASVSLLWGTTYMVIRVGVETFPPMLFAGIRHFIAGVLLLSYFLFIKKTPLPPRREFKHIAVMGLLMLTFGNGLFVWAEKYVNSNIAALLSTLSPFFVFVFSWMAGNEKPSPKLILGLTLGIVGQVALFYDKWALMEEPEYFWAMLALVAGAICWSYGSVYRRKADLSMNALYFTGWQMLIGGFAFIPFALIKGEQHEMHNIQPEAIWAIIYLIILGSIVAYGSFMYVLAKLPTTVVSMHTYINIIVAVILGWAILEEDLNWMIGISTILTLTGVYLVNQSLRAKRLPVKRRP